MRKIVHSFDMGRTRGSCAAPQSAWPAPTKAVASCYVGLVPSVTRMAAFGYFELNPRQFHEKKATTVPDRVIAETCNRTTCNDGDRGYVSRRDIINLGL